MTLTSSELSRVTQCMASFPADVIGQIVLASSDVCLFIGADLVVLDFVVGATARDIDCAPWQGQSLRALVGAEGQSKINHLWSAKGSASVAGQTSWRHLNFRAHGVPLQVPLLVQRIAARDGSSILVCRDLRPSVQMQQRFNSAMIEIERGYLDAQSDPLDTPMDVNAQGVLVPHTPSSEAAQAKALVQQAFDDLGAQPLSQIVSRSAQMLEDMCIRKALAQCGYDVAQTARVLDMDADDLARRLVFFSTKC